MHCTLLSQVFESGFESSAIMEIKRGGSDLNNDGIPDFLDNSLFGRKIYDQSEGEYAKLYDFQNNHNIYYPEKIVTGDLNGDGIDDPVMFSINPYQTGEERDLIISAFKGDDGELLFSHSIKAFRHENFYLIDALCTDIKGNGKDEIALLIYRKVEGGFTQNKIPLLYILDQSGNELFKREIFNDARFESTGSFKFAAIDYNGDQYDDLLVLGSYLVGPEPQYKNKVVLYDGKTDFISEKTPASLESRKTSELKFISGTFGSNSRDNAIFIYSDEFTSDGELIYKILRKDFLTGEEIVKPVGDILPPNTTSFPTLINKAHLLDKVGEDLIISFRTGLDFDNDGTRDQYTLAAIETEHLTPIFSNTNNLEFSGYSTNILPADFNNDGLDEVCHIYRAFNDISHDNIPDGAIIELLDKTGSASLETNNIKIGLDDISLSDGIYGVTSGFFNDNKFRDLGILLRWGEDTDGDGLKDGSLFCLFEPESETLIFSKTSQSNVSETRKTENIITLDNEITDKELLRMLDLSATHLTECRRAFLKKDYSDALNFYKYYYINKRKEPANLIKSEYYYINNHDEFLERLKKFSTTATLEIPGFQWYGNLYDDPGAGSLRFGRISATFGSRVYDTGNIDLNTFNYGLKSMISHLRWLDRDENYTDANNHALLFEIREYVLASAFLSDFKQFNIFAPYSFQKTMQSRINYQLSHILPDGVHDEHSITYSFLVGNILNMFADYFIKNDFYTMGEQLNSDIIIKAENMFEYFLYMVKPIELFTTDSVMMIRPDIPVIGDSESKIVARWYGKQSATGNSSILNEPLITNQTDNWFNRELVSNLQFGAYNSLKQVGTPPAEISKAFPFGGFFVSRSNWVKPLTPNQYDHSARYLHFKAGEIVPTPGPYNGYATNSRHGHADLLSVDIAAYNKNLIVDPGGYVNPTMTQLISQFSPSYYVNLYNSNPPVNNFDMVRSYFKSTAGHSTVYIDHGQLTYKSNWSWYDLNSITSLPLKYRIAENFDFVVGAYQKSNSHGDYTHSRTIVYNKPMKNNRVYCDYWVILDRIDFTSYNANPPVEQVWHISPEQRNVTIDSIGELSGDNFKMLPVDLGAGYNLTSEMIPGYTMTYSQLNEAKVVKYKAVQDEDKVVFATIILPYSENSPISDITYVKNPVYDQGGNELSPFDACGIKLTFTTSDQHQIEDYLVIAPDLLYDSFNAEKVQSGKYSNNYWEFQRYIDGALSNNDSAFRKIEAGTKQLLEDESPTNFSLSQNYPNPFNPETKIEFSIPFKAHVKLIVYDLLGNKVSTLLDKDLNEGDHRINFDGTALSSGVYIYKITSYGYNGETFADSRKMILLK